MEIAMDAAWGGGLVLVCVLAWCLNLITLPGNWLAVAVVAAYCAFGPEEGRVSVGWQVTAICFVAALAGEIFEFVAGAMGAKRAGASRRSTLFAVIGSMIGALVGAVVGVPVPVIGQLIAALLFGAAGATAGAIYGEWTDGKSWQESWTVGQSAFWGRLFGTLGKFIAGFAILFVVVIAVML